MPSYTFDSGANGINSGSIDLLVDRISVMLVSEVPSQNADSLLGMNELSVAGAVRQTLTGKTVTLDTRLHRSTFNAANPPMWTLALGDHVAGAVIFDDVGSDAQSTPLFFCDTRVEVDGVLYAIPTNGSTFKIEWNAEGIGYTQQFAFQET